MAGTDGVDIQALHHLDVLNHALHAYVVTSIRVHLMTVGTLQENRLTVDQELLVLDFHLAETYLYLYNLAMVKYIPPFWIGDTLQGIEVRCLGTPLCESLLHTELILSRTILYIIVYL